MSKCLVRILLVDGTKLEEVAYRAGPEYRGGFLVIWKGEDDCGHIAIPADRILRVEASGPV